MRGAVVVLMLVGCGRIAFDPLSDAGTGGSGDATDAKGSSQRMFYISGDGAAADADLFEVDVATGQLTLRGTVPMAYGEADGLAVWDANHLYMTSYSGNLIEITLSPFGTQLVTGGLPPLSSLDRVGNQLLGVDDAGDQLVFLTPAPFNVDSSAALFDGGTGVTVDGGDITPLSPTVFLFWTNVGRFSRVSPSGTVTPVGNDPGAPYMVGLARIGTTLYGATRDGAQLFEIDPINGNRKNPVTLCVACPTPYGSTYGDLAADP